MPKHPTDEFDLVMFGGLGDLALRKLLPALYLLHYDQRVVSGTIILVNRRDYNDQQLLEKVHDSLKTYLPVGLFDEQYWQEFSARIRSARIDLSQPNNYQTLDSVCTAKNKHRIFYCATGSNLYIDICRGLKAASLISYDSKIVLEKPIGSDFGSANNINQQVAEFFEERQIYRIDHYLGKETVQNLLVLRFANRIFESQWNQNFIDHIQITISESNGVESRAGFYDQVGALRDMFQNHLLQLLCITAMEPPSRLEPDAIRDEKVKVLRALKSINVGNIDETVVRGQYRAGVSGVSPVVGYQQESGVQENSTTETFIAAKVEIDNFRWAGVPFYLRTGKRLPSRACEIMVKFKSLPHSIFPKQSASDMTNKLVFRLQPDEGIRLQLSEKRIGAGMQVRPVDLNLTPENHNEERVPEAYERLLFDVLNGNATLFLRDDELQQAWRYVDPILSSWQSSDQPPEPYTAGSWGPAAATLLLARDGRLWDED